MALDFTPLANAVSRLDEGDLPWKVDLVDRKTVSPEFAAIIDAGKVPLVR